MSEQPAIVESHVALSETLCVEAEAIWFGMTVCYPLRKCYDRANLADLDFCLGDYGRIHRRSDICISVRITFKEVISVRVKEDLKYCSLCI